MQRVPQPPPCLHNWHDIAWETGDPTEMVVARVPLDHHPDTPLGMITWRMAFTWRTRQNPDRGLFRGLLDHLFSAIGPF
jgi:hypothetical protein